MGFLRAVALFHTAGDRIDFREIAFVRILALLIVLAGLFQATRKRGDPRGIALSFVLVFGYFQPFSGLDVDRLSRDGKDQEYPAHWNRSYIPPVASFQ